MNDNQILVVQSRGVHNFMGMIWWHSFLSFFCYHAFFSKNCLGFWQIPAPNVHFKTFIGFALSV